MRIQGRGKREEREEERELSGIVIADGRRRSSSSREPRIAAFIWGGKVRPTPTLPFGRWKGAA